MIQPFDSSWPISIWSIFDNLANEHHHQDYIFGRLIIRDYIQAIQSSTWSLFSIRTLVHNLTKAHLQGNHK